MLNVMCESVSNWDELVLIYNKWFRKPEGTCDQDQLGWVFRGQPNAGWSLETSLDREINKARKEAKATDEEEPCPHKVEDGLIREFQRRYYHFDQSPPPIEETPEWLAIMQHYGAPTRLLDWTYSFYVAVYFGIESADNGGAVWAVDAKWCRIAAEILLTGDPNHNFNFGKKGKLFDRYLRHRKNPTPLVYPVNAFRLNPRIAAQRGTFICSGDVTHTFYENLTGMKAKLDERIAKCQDIPGWTHEKIVNFESHSFLRKIIIGRGARRKILQELYRYNISFSSLYPDLEGFAKSLKTRISIPGSLPT